MLLECQVSLCPACPSKSVWSKWHYQQPGCFFGTPFEFTGARKRPRPVKCDCNKVKVSSRYLVLLMMLYACIRITWSGRIEICNVSYIFGHAVCPFQIQIWTLPFYWLLTNWSMLGEILLSKTYCVRRMWIGDATCLCGWLVWICLEYV